MSSLKSTTLWITTAVFLCVGTSARAVDWTSEARIDRWFQQLKAGADSTDGLIALDQLEDHQEYLDVTPRLQAMARDLLGRRATDPVLAARLHEWLGTAADRRGDVEESRREFEAAGYLVDWSTLGPYPNYGGAAMARDVGPQQEGCEDGCAEEGRTMAWVERPGFGAHGYLNLRASFEERSDVVVFLRCFVHVEQQTPVALRVGGGDGLLVEINRQAVLEDPARRNPQPDQVATGTALPAGWSEVRIKAGQESGAWGIYLRFTRPDGRPLEGLTAQAAPPPGWVPSPLPAVETAIHQPVADALARGEQEGADGATRARAAKLARQLDLADRRDDQVVQHLRAALESDPESPELNLLLADESDEPEEQLLAIRRAVELAPDLGDAQLALYRYHRRHQNYRDELATLRLALADPTHLGAAKTHVEELRMVDAPEAALEELLPLLERHPHAPTLEVLRAQIWIDLGRHDKAIEAYEASLRRTDLASTRSRLASIQRQSGNWDYSVMEHHLLAQRFPDALTYQRGLARELWRAGRREEAVAHLQSVRGRFPDGAGLLREMGDLLQRLGRQEEAQEAWMTSLAIQPRNPSLEQYMTHLEGGEDPLREAYRRDPDTLPLTGGDLTLYEDVAARILLFGQATQVFPNGSSQEYVQQVIRIDSEVGARAYQSVSLPYDREREYLRVLTAETIHPDGTTSRAQNIWDDSSVGRAAGMYYQVYSKEITFESLWPGDMVHLEYKRESREQRNRFNDFFGALVLLQSWVPTVEAHIRIAVPAEMQLFLGGKLPTEPIETEVDEFRVHEIRAFDLQAMPAEAGGPGAYEVGSYLSASNFETWDQVAAWWIDLSRPQFRLGEEGQRIARELAEEAPDREAAIRAIYQYVQRNTHYVGLEFGIHGWKPYEARQTLERGYGDCKDKATLLVAMLDAVDVEAQVVLLQTVVNGRSTEEPANLHAFNHAIAYVPELDLYLDGTAEYSPVESLRWDDQGAMALRVSMDGKGTLVTIPISPPGQNLTRSFTTLEVEASGDVRFHEHWEEEGLLVSELRHAYHDDSTRAQALEDNYQGRLTGVQLTDVQAEGFQDLGNLLALDVYGDIPAFARPDGDKIRVPVTLFPDDLGQNLTPESEDGRRTDLVMRLPHEVEISTTVLPPPGMEVGDLPAPVHLEHPRATYEQTVTLEQGQAVVRIRMVYLDRRVPVAEYPTFREFCLAIDRAQDLTIELRPVEGSR